MAIALRLFLGLSIVMLSGCFKVDLSFLPTFDPPVQESKQGRYYTVRNGDTLYAIGRRFDVDYKSLARRNGISYPYTIYAGQRIYLSGTHKVTPTAKTTQRSRKITTVAKSKSPKPTPSKTYHPADTGSVRLIWPVKGTVTSRFGRRGSRMHDGIDIGAKEGTPVYAAAGGKVIYADNKLSGFGNLIIIKHTADFVTIYAHNQKNLVYKNQQIKRGQLIARVGQTGRATGPHLHFEVRRGKKPGRVRAVDPMAYLP